MTRPNLSDGVHRAMQRDRIALHFGAFPVTGRRTRCLQSAPIESSHIRHRAPSGRIQECVLVEDQIMNDMAKLELSIHGPVCETLLGAPDKLVRADRLRAETMRHDVLV